MGGCGDSYYEYEVKEWIRHHHDTERAQAIRRSWRGMDQLLVKRSRRNGLLHSGQVMTKRYLHTMDELTCFLPGTLLLYLYHEDGMGAMDDAVRRENDHYRTVAKSLLYSCFVMANSTRTGLPPETATFSDTQGILIRKNQKHYALRPETIESFFYLKETEHDPIAQEWGWLFYQAIERNCRVDGGYAMFSDVHGDGAPEDTAESYFPAETLKYLYLLFKPDSVVDLKRNVLTTEGHIFPIRAYPCLFGPQFLSSPHSFLAITVNIRE